MLGPIEVIVVGFPGNQFNGEILPELQRLVDNDIVAIVDGLLVSKQDDGSIEMVEFDQPDSNASVERLSGLVNRVEALISDDDVAELAAGLEPNSSAAILAFEHTWSKPFRDAVVGSGGSLVANFRVPGAVIEELLDELSGLED